MASLERLEAMNRHAINLAFPLLTGGVLVGAALMIQAGYFANGWFDPRVLGAQPETDATVGLLAPTLVARPRW